MWLQRNNEEMHESCATYRSNKDIKESLRELCGTRRMEKPGMTCGG